MNEELIEQVARAADEYLGVQCGMKLRRHALDNLAKAAIAAMQPHIAAQREDAARRALEAAAAAYQADAETWLQISRRAACARQGAKIIRAIDPAQFREAGNG